MNPTDPAYPALSYWRPTTNEADDDAMVRDGPTGFCAQAYAAIRLRVPRSGIDWLDEMILEAQLNEFAGQALIGLLASESLTNGSYKSPADGASDANIYASEMQAESDRRKEGPK